MAEPPYRLLAIDLDGTLLNAQHRVSPRNRAALHAAHEAGLKIVLCTGRAWPETQPVIAEIGLDLDAAVSAFGAVVTEVATGRTLTRRSFSAETARELTRWFRAADYSVQWLVDREEAGFDGFIFDGPRRHPAVDRWLSLTPCQVRCAPGPPDDAPRPVRISIIDDLEPLQTMSADLTRRFDGRVVHNVLSAPAYRLSVIESFAPQVNKWNAIAWLCDRWQIAPDATIGFGDDVNDLELVERAGLGVAMSNARPELKAAAALIAADHDDDGVARVVEDLLAGGNLA